jgi:SAM-dependent methyltransferase
MISALRSLDPLRRSVLAMRDVRSRWIDSRLGIDTRPRCAGGGRAAGFFADGERYESIDYDLLARYARLLPAGPDDVVYDVGCGMGRVLCVFARRGVKRCVGIEIDPELAEIARENAARLRGRRCPIDVRVGDAAFADYSEGTIYYLFNPFGPKTVRSVLRRIGATLHRDPRRLHVAYCHPHHEWVLEDCDWLRCSGRARSAWYANSISFWTNAVTGSPVEKEIGPSLV